MTKSTFFLGVVTSVIVVILFFTIFPVGSRKEATQSSSSSYLKAGIDAKEKGESKVFGPHKTKIHLSKKDDISSPNLGEKAGLAILFTPEGKTKVLYKKNINKGLSFASLTKLMTAMVVLDNYPLDKQVEVSKNAVSTLGEAGLLKVEEKINVRGLLDLSLLVSSNDAAAALAEVAGKKKFVKWMNKKAQEIGLENTTFVNPHGLDQEAGKNNISTAHDISLMMQYAVGHYPLIKKTLVVEEKNIPSSLPSPHHARNTNKLLKKDNVFGGKTGYTEDAKDCMVIVSKAPGRIKGNIVFVVLGVDHCVGRYCSKNGRIVETEKLYEWVKEAYSFQ